MHHYLNTLFLTLIIVNQMTCDIGIKFTRQPEPIDVPYLDVVEFECGLNIPSERVEWCHNGKVIDSQNSQNNSNSNISKQESKASHSLTIPFNDYSLIGDYQCVAWYGASAIISTAAKLSLADMKPFSKQPDESYEVAEGNDVIISCPSPESRPEAYIQYFKDTSLITNANLLQTTNSLFIKNANVTNSGVYICMASNSITGQEYKSPFKIDLKVNNNMRQRAPYFLRDPQKKYAIESGSNITIECNAVSNPKPKIYWSKSNNNRLNNRSFEDGTILTIVNVEPSDSGIYTCKADNGISQPLNRDIEIEVLESPKLIKEPETNTVNENESIEFACSFKGNPTPKIDWYLNSKLLINDKNLIITEGKLRINFAEKKHAGIYQCFATNRVGSTFGITMLQVYPTQKEIFAGSNDNIFNDIKMFNESHYHHQHQENKKHKNKHHRGKNKGLKDVVMTPPTRPNITRLSDKSVMVRWSLPTPYHGLPIQFFKVQYKEIGSKNSRKTNRWMTSNEDIPSHIRSYEIDGLETNQTYRFRIAAVYSNNDNKLSPNSHKFHLHKISNANKNKPKPPSLTETEAISPTVVQIHWQYLNSVLSPVDGFYIYYRAASSAGDYIKSTVEGQDVRSFNITHLQANTHYEIKLQSFTVGAASDFSTILVGHTLVDPNEKSTIENATEITNTIDTTSTMSTNSSKTYVYVIVGVILGLLTIISILYVVMNIMKNKPKRDNTDEDSNDNDKTDSLTAIPQITDSTTTMNGFVNHSPPVAQNGAIPNGVQSNSKGPKINGKVSNGYINKTLVHSNHVSNDEDEPLNMMPTSAARDNPKPLPPRTTLRDVNPHDIINSNADSREYETLNMIQGIHEMNPGTRESINIINNPLESNAPQYNIELNYLSCVKNNVNNRNQNHPLQPSNRQNILSRNKIDLENLEFELGNNLDDIGNASLRMKHKLSNNNNNNKIINNNTKYSQNNNDNTNNWRGRSVVDTRRNDNYM